MKFVTLLLKRSAKIKR